MARIGTDQRGWLGALFVAAAFCMLPGCGGSSATSHVIQNLTPVPDPSSTPFPLGAIQHVIIIVQENRTTDNLFNGLPGADTVQSGWYHGSQVPLTPLSMGEGGDYDHSHGAFLTSYDKGAMDGWPAGYRGSPFVYVPASETQPYRDLAAEFGFADRMFQSNEGPSYAAHLYLVGGTSIPSLGSSLLASENPGNPTHQPPVGGCGSDPQTTVPLIDPSGDEKYRLYPCFEHPVIMDLLDAAGVSWSYYEPQKGGFWDGPSSIGHIYNSPSDAARIITPETQILNDIAAGDLAGVSWVIPNGENSDHPDNHSLTGPSWVASIVNAVGESKYWKTSAIFVTWDDWGGLYDHVKPPIYDAYDIGFRVPLLMISPYVTQGCVSHKQHEFGSILRFVEDAWGLGTLGYADTRSDDLSDCFDFQQEPRSYIPVNAPYSRSYFQRSHRVFQAPDND